MGEEKTMLVTLHTFSPEAISAYGPTPLYDSPAMLTVVTHDACEEGESSCPTDNPGFLCPRCGRHLCSKECIDAEERKLDEHEGPQPRKFV